jgi:hypothetical protein
MLNSGGVVATYWFYDDLTMHRESTVLGFTTTHAGYYSASDTTLDVQAIGSPPESYTYEIEGDTLTLTDPGTGSISYVKQATLEKPANTIPTVAIDGGDAMAIPGSQVSFTITADPSDASQTLAYQWYVDNALQDGETADTFTYDMPVSGTTHAIEVVVSDGFDLAADSIVLAPITPSPKVFEQWDGDSWESLGIYVPEGTLDAFSYNDNLTVRFANNELWRYSGGAWSELSTSAPTGTIQATSLDSSASGFHYVFARNASGICSVYDGSTWTDCSGWFPAMPAGTLDFTMLGSSLIMIPSSGIIQYSDGSLIPFADRGNPGTPTAEAVKLLGLGDYGSTLVYWAVTDSDDFWSGNDNVPTDWVDTGLSVPSDAIDVFLYGGSLTIRR